MTREEITKLLGERNAIEERIVMQQVAVRQAALVVAQQTDLPTPLRPYMIAGLRGNTEKLKAEIDTLELVFAEHLPRIRAIDESIGW